MATAQFATVSNSTAEVTDIDAVKELLDDHHLGNLDIDFVGENEDEINISGYDSLSVLQVDEHGDPHGHPVTDEFLEKLSSYIADGEQLDIRTVGNTKLRHVFATRYVVTSDSVTHTSLEDGTNEV
jgi:hypothetical protein